MTRAVVAGLVIAIAGVGAGISMSAADAPVTFAKDVLPILQKNCQSCHRPGQIAPMSLLTYDEARPWARSIKTKVESRQMPPWFADPQHGQFANDRSLSPARHRDDREVGRRRGAAGQSGRCAAADRVAGRWLADQARRHREGARVPGAGAHAQ